MGLKGAITDLKCFTATSSYPLNIVDYIIGVAAVLYILFVIYASFYEIKARHNTEAEYNRLTGSGIGWIYSCFSVAKNWNRLVTIQKKSPPNKLQSMQGLRVCVMVCVVLAHSLMFHFRLPQADIKFMENITNKPWNMLFINGHYVVQVFFVISGWLLTYHFFQLFDKYKTVQYRFIVLAFINRIMRIWPVLLTVLAIHSTWIIQMGDGPLWDETAAGDYHNCRRLWWTNMFFVNNIVEPHNMCLQQTWYLAADMQLYVVTLLLFIFLWTRQYMTKYILAFGHIIGLAIPAYVVYSKNYDIQLRMYPEHFYLCRMLKDPIWTEMFTAPYNNIGSWIIGVNFGYLFFHYKDVKIFTKKIYVNLWTIFVCSSILSVIFAAVFMYQDDYEHSRTISAFYWAVSKPLFGLGFATAIFGFSQGIGVSVKRFLESDSMEILSRLTYSAYIVHVLFNIYRLGLGRTPFYSSYTIKFYQIFGDFCIVYIVAMFVYILVEMPFSNLQKAFVLQLAEKRNAEKSKELNNNPREKIQ